MNKKCVENWGGTLKSSELKYTTKASLLGPHLEAT
jgi:hypothetical protein